MEAGLYRTNQELGSTVSLQVTSAWVRGHVPAEGQVINEPARSHWLTRFRLSRWQMMRQGPITGQTTSSCPIRAQTWRKWCCIPTNGRT